MENKKRKRDNEIRPEDTPGLDPNAEGKKKKKPKKTAQEQQTGTYKVAKKEDKITVKQGGKSFNIDPSSKLGKLLLEEMKRPEHKGKESINIPLKSPLGQRIMKEIAKQQNTKKDQKNKTNIGPKSDKKKKKKRKVVKRTKTLISGEERSLFERLFGANKKGANKKEAKNGGSVKKTVFQAPGFTKIFGKKVPGAKKGIGTAKSTKAVAKRVKVDFNKFAMLSKDMQRLKAFVDANKDKIPKRLDTAKQQQSRPTITR